MRGKIVRTDFPNDKREILDDRVSIQTQRFGCGAAALRLGLSGDGNPCQAATLQIGEMKTEKCEESLFALFQSEPAAVQVLPTMTPSSSVAVSSSQLQRVAVIISRISSRSAYGVSSKAGWSRRLVPQEPWRRRMPLVLSRGCSTGVIFPNRLGGLNCWLISDRFRPFLTDSDQKKEKFRANPGPSVVKTSPVFAKSAFPWLNTPTNRLNMNP
jgi:hypothetical protein